MELGGYLTVVALGALAGAVLGLATIYLRRDPNRAQALVVRCRRWLPISSAALAVVLVLLLLRVSLGSQPSVTSSVALRPAHAHPGLAQSHLVTRRARRTKASHPSRVHAHQSSRSHRGRAQRPGTTTRRVTPVGPLLVAAALVVHNRPRTTRIGGTEYLSALLPGRPQARLVLLLRYPDGREERVATLTDRRGFAQHLFRLTGYRLRRPRERALVGVEDARGHTLAVVHFMIGRARH